MKYFLTTVLALLVNCCGFAQAVTDPDAITVMTYNIRYNDGAEGMFSWPNRMPLVIEQVLKSNADLAGMQEVLYSQLVSLNAQLAGYRSYGVGRDDGKQAGEFAPVFWKADRFQLLDSGYFWLSATPEIPRLGWNASCIRIATWVKLHDVNTGKNFYFFNTHFDHVGHRARRNSAILLLRKIAEICVSADVIVTGDFNFSSRNIVYRRMTNLLNGLADTKKISENKHAGPAGSFVGFPYQTRKHADIDMIFVSRGSARVLNHTTVEYEHSGSYPSDHLPVITTIIFKK